MKVMPVKEIEAWVWNAWKKNKTLPTISRELSKRTYWSRYYSLCFAVDFLHNKMGVGFSRKQLKYAFSKVKEEISPEDVKDAWVWLLSLGGFRYERGRKKAK